MTAIIQHGCSPPQKRYFPIFHTFAFAFLKYLEHEAKMAMLFVPTMVSAALYTSETSSNPVVESANFAAFEVVGEKRGSSLKSGEDLAAADSCFKVSGQFVYRKSFYPDLALQAMQNH